MNPFIRNVLTSRAGSALFHIGSSLLYHGAVRRLMVRFADRWLRARLDPHTHTPTLPRSHTSSTWRQIARQRTLIYLAVLHTVDRVIERRLLAPHVARVITERWGRALASVGKGAAVMRFRHEHGVDPPWFLVISPGHTCNLHCAGCYADSGPGAATLEWPVLDRIISEAKALWGVPLFVFSGGEPLLYRSAGKDVFDVVHKHADCLFLMFTNGTLIDQKMADRLARLGNLTPALSVEGLRERTDARRGAGTFDRVLQAVASLREAGVPFGLSITVTRENCAEVLSDEFLDLFFDELGAFYAFLFQYMPIGRSPSFDLMPTPEQWIQFWRRSWHIVETRHIFLLDFWNHGPLVEGCISAGREHGYMYIDWNGNVMPCVFAPYAAANIHQVYARGGTLADVWGTPFFQAIRQWQRDYGYGQRMSTSEEELPAEGNWLSPCPFRDHYGQFRQWVERYRAAPEDQAAADALRDREYYERMVAYGAQSRESSREIWEREFCSKE